MLNEVQIVSKFLNLRKQAEERGLKLEADNSTVDDTEPNFLLLSKSGNHCCSSNVLNDIDIAMRGYDIFLAIKGD